MSQNDWFSGNGQFGGLPTTVPFTTSKKCYEDHPVLKVGGGTLIGGNCAHPTCKAADVYIGLDRYSYAPRGGENYPWSPSKAKKGPEQDFLFGMSDMQAPHKSDTKDFLAMVQWIVEQLAAGKTVHVGCMGGHGRTGTVFAGVYALLFPGEKDVIGKLRKDYCKKAVESTAQVEFLVKHYGVKKVSGYKSELGSNKVTGSAANHYLFPPSDYPSGGPKPKQKGIGEVVTPITSSLHIFQSAD